jgi:hypothetical protein
MMGSRGYRGGEECEAFSRGSRRIVGWKRGTLRAIKRRFWKGDRKTARQEVRGAVAIARGQDGM